LLVAGLVLVVQTALEVLAIPSEISVAVKLYPRLFLLAYPTHMHGVLVEPSDGKQERSIACLAGRVLTFCLVG